MPCSETLLHVTRGALAESMHRGHIAVVDFQGKVHYSSGDPQAVIFARSSMKPIQALPVLESGAADAFGFTEQEIALLCASHSGEELHTATAAGMLHKLKLGPQHLLCGPHAPFDQSAAAKLAACGQKPTELHNNCSGKHTGMLALALRLGADISGYTAPGHPVQLLMRATVSAVAGYPEADIIIGTDGCGVPVFGLPLQHLAAAYAVLGQLAQTGDSALRNRAAARIIAALRAHPFMLAGTGRYDSKLIEVTKGRIIGKMGAEGVFALTVPELGMGLALKVEDGAQRGLYPVATEALAQLGWLTPAEIGELEDFHRPAVRNWRGDPVGRLLPVFRLRRHS